LLLQGSRGFFAHVLHKPVNEYLLLARF